MKITTLAALAAFAAPSLAGATTYSFTTIDNPGDPTFNQLLGINDNGVIVGYFGSGAAGHPNQAYQISPPYTAFSPRNVAGAVQTQVTGINNSNQTVGFFSQTDNGAPLDANAAFTTTKIGANTATILGNDLKVASNPSTDQLLGINNSNLAVGFYIDAAGNSHGYSYLVTTAQVTPVVIGGSVSTAATGINDNGQICGTYVTAKGAMLAFVRNSNGGVVTHFRVPGSMSTQLFGINNSGVAVGTWVDSNMINHGLVYTPSTGNWTTVDAPSGVGGTILNGLNNNGQIVGFYTDAAGNTHGALVTSQ